MKASIMSDRVQIQVRTETLGPLGQTYVWKPDEECRARVRLVSATGRVAYQQVVNSLVTHEVIMRGKKTLNFDYRIKWNDKTLEPVEPPQYRLDSTIIACKEL